MEEVSIPSTTKLEDRQFLSPVEFARLSGLSLSTVARYLANGKLPYYQPGGKGCRVLIPRSGLQDVDVNAARKGASSERAPSSTDIPTAARQRSGLAGPRPKWMR